MELIQINWDEQENLFLKFKKEPEEIAKFNSDTVNRINLQYKISKIDHNFQALKAPPFWFSTKNLYFSDNAMGIPLELEEIQNINSLQIELIKLKIIYKSGDIEQISINEKFPLENIFTNDACYLDFPKEQKILKSRSSTEITIKEKKSIKISTIDLIDYEKQYLSKKHIENLDDFSLIQKEIPPLPISEQNFEALINIKGDKSWSALTFIIRELFVRLNYVEQELKESNATIREIALKNAEALCNRPSIVAPPPPNPPQLMQPTSLGPPKRSLASGSPKNLITDKSSTSLQAHTAVIREMQEKFIKISNIKELLTKVPEEVLKREIPRTDHLGFLEFKENRKEQNE